MSRKPLAHLRSLAPAVLLIAGSSLAQAECTPSDLNSAEQSYSTAYQFAQGNQWAEAIPSLEIAVAACPEHWPSMELMAQAKMRTSVWSDAVDYYERLIEGKHGGVLLEAGAQVLQPFGFVLLKNRGFDRAEQVYESILRTDPNNVKAHERLVFAYSNTGSLRSAIDHLQILYGMSEGEEKTQYAKRIGKAYKKLGDTEESNQWYETAGGGSGLFGVGVEAMNKQQWSKAVSTFEKIVADKPGSVAGWKNLGQSLTAQKKHNEAIKAYEKALDIDASRHDIATSLGFAYSEIGRWADAGRVASVAVQEWTAGDEQVGAMYYLMGKVYEKRDGDYEQAITMFERARSDSYWGDMAVQEITRQRQLIEIRQLQKAQG
jgi:tetratricopeptide (TPR) repeat protein